MPRLSVLFVRAALLYLLIGFTFGGLLLANKGVPLHASLWAVLPAHIEFLLLGWMVQLAFGVAFWILPRFGRGPRRGEVRLAWAALVLLNLGVLAVALAGVFPAWSWLAPAGRVGEALAVLAFALHAWPRVKPLGA
jgi:hypothetical protein